MRIGKESKVENSEREAYQISTSKIFQVNLLGSQILMRFRFFPPEKVPWATNFAIISTKAMFLLNKVN
jgi:hypothetical protein